MSSEIDPYILEQFSLIKKLGKGAYGVVWEVINK